MLRARLGGYTRLGGSGGPLRGALDQEGLAGLCAVASDPAGPPRGVWWRRSHPFVPPSYHHIWQVAASDLAGLARLGYAHVQTKRNARAPGAVMSTHVQRKGNARAQPSTMDTNSVWKSASPRPRRQPAEFHV